jgi:hypothetical protein
VTGAPQKEDQRPFSSMADRALFVKRCPAIPAHWFVSILRRVRNFASRHALTLPKQPSTLSAAFRLGGRRIDRTGARYASPMLGNDTLPPELAGWKRKLLPGTPASECDGCDARIPSNNALFREPGAQVALRYGLSGTNCISLSCRASPEDVNIPTTAPIGRNRPLRMS